MRAVARRDSVGQGVRVRVPRLALALSLALLPAGAGAEEVPFAAIRDTEVRLATTGYRLAIGNATLCDRLRPGLGLQLHTLRQYQPDVREAAQAFFGFEGQVAVEGVVAGSPAERAGVRAGDTIVAINDAPPPDAAASTGTEQLIAVEQRLSDLPTQAPVAMTVRRDGRERRVSVVPVAQCRSRYELLISSSWDASADGDMVQLGTRFMELGDEAAAVIVAHELAHNILRHPDRLRVAGAGSGVLAEFGRSARLYRRTEDEADLLSVYLLANAGYDPMIGARFWRGRGRSIGGGLLRGRSHASPADRARAMEAAARDIAGQGRPVVPAALLATRDQAL
jgi:hypothetical protein